MSSNLVQTRHRDAALRDAALKNGITKKNRALARPVGVIVTIDQNV